MTDNQRKAKAVLDALSRYAEDIKSKRLKAEMIRTKLEGGAINYDKLPVKSSVSNFTEELKADLVDLELEIEEDLALIDEQYSNTYKQIKNVQNLNEQNVLYGYYIDGFSYEGLAERMELSLRTIFRLMDDALESYGKLL